MDPSECVLRFVNLSNVIVKMSVHDLDGGKPARRERNRVYEAEQVLADVGMGIPVLCHSTSLPTLSQYGQRALQSAHCLVLVLFV